MGLPRTFTVVELEELSGFDRRTIAYYISEGLLPKVGRRGPKTRYSEDFLQRLQLIKRIRELLDAGRLPQATLADISGVLRGLSAKQIKQLAHQSTPESELADLFQGARPAPDEDVQMARPDPADLSADYQFSAPPKAASRRRARLMASRAAPTASRDMSSDPVGEELPDSVRSVLRELERRAQRGRQSMGITSSEILTRIPITSNIMLSVRGMVAEEDRQFAEQVAALLAGYFD
ncbi:MAG: MerR family transcriptional regulator [Gammaproteobacteria bacterium]